nr:MAG TPA: stabilization protein [Caudoviricetes sp.]
MQDGNTYFGQHGFTTGEISPEVLARTDLDKYQYALKTAKNAYIKPYGTVYRRSGTIYHAEVKDSTKKAILVEFAVSADLSYLLEFGPGYIRVYKYGEYLGVEVATPFTESDLTKLRFAQSADVMYITSGRYPVKTLSRYGEKDWRFANFSFTQVYYDTTLGATESNAGTVSASGTTGNITLSASTGIFSAGHVGGHMKITHEMPSATAHVVNGTSGAVRCGDGWKIITHGTWTGTVTVQRNTGSGWQEYRKYTASNDFNPSESGTVEDVCQFRVVCSISSGSCTVDLTALPYTHDGMVRITGVSNSKTATATVEKELGGTGATDLYYWGAWDDAFGYPFCVCFFQDRLCFAATTAQPYMLWMSRTGDYANFGVEKADGTVTDDSAIALSFISRQQYKILHLVPTADLIVMTDGNEWMVSGSSTVTPTSATAKNQTSRGCTDVVPISIGAKLVYVQRRGKVVRDIGYSFESDQYDGADLTILAKHLTKDSTIIDAAYLQEPDSVIYFVTDDGTINCLTYVKDQNVYAWSTIQTDGAFEAVCSTASPDGDRMYCIVNRTINGTAKRYIESFAAYPTSDHPNDYTMLDCSESLTNEEATDTVTGLTWLAGKTVTALADGTQIDDQAVAADGSVTLPVKAKEIVIGLPYVTDIELPSIFVQAQDGTITGRKKKVSGVTLQLTNSLGGSIGHEADYLDDIKYDEFGNEVVTLYTGFKAVTMPNRPTGGFLEDSSLLIETRAPYPLHISQCVRAVAFE